MSMNLNFKKARDKYLEKIRWKPYEIDIIKNNYKNLSDEQIQQEFLSHRNISAITVKRRGLGFHKETKRNQIWTQQEVEILLSVWKDYNQRQISEQFIPTKTPIQVSQKKMKMGLKKIVWTPEEIDLLFEYGSKMKRRDLKRLHFPNKTVDQISWAKRYHNIKRK
jgi:hypothetical protein